MEKARAAWLDPAFLGPDFVVGRWRIRARGGRGTYGVVYQVEREGQPEAGVFALKLATHPHDPRYAREVELLVRIRHAGVPVLMDAGWWQPPGGPPFPYLVMRWVEGMGLYEWGKTQPRTSRQVLRVLAQVARALAATHAAGCLHRDVKGDNVLVDGAGRAVLLDFGAGTHMGARPLTYEALPPSTPPYRSPEALRFQWKHRRASGACYQATAADDVYALGVTAYHLCTGTYPPPATDPSAVGDDGRATPEVRVPPGELVTLSLELEALILRMLSEASETRGTAAELAEALEQAAERAKSEADKPISPRPCHAPTVRTERPGPPQRQSRRALWSSGLAMIVTWAVLAASARWHAPPEPSTSPQTPETGADDWAAVGVADAATTDIQPYAGFFLRGEAIALDMPERPLRKQKRAPCTQRGEVEIRGGCWARLADITPPCGKDAYEWKGSCYWPIAAQERPSTSNQP